MSGSDHTKDERGSGDQPTNPSRATPHTGSGAETALQAMLKKRKMRASRDADAQAPPTDGNGAPTCDN